MTCRRSLKACAKLGLASLALFNGTGAEAESNTWIRLQNEWLSVGIDADVGAKIRSLVWRPTNMEMADEFMTHEGPAGGLAEDRFAGERYPGEAGTAAFRLAAPQPDHGRSVVFERISDPASGRTLRIIKSFELDVRSATVTVDWRIENLGVESVRIVPWVHNIVTEALDRTVYAFADGVAVAGRGPDYFLKPWGNWIAAWRENGMAVGFVAELDVLMRQYYSYWNGLHSLEWAYYPVELAPNQMWGSRYHIVVADDVAVPEPGQAPAFLPKDGPAILARQTDDRGMGPFKGVEPNRRVAAQIGKASGLSLWQAPAVDRIFQHDLLEADADLARYAPATARGGLLLIPLALKDTRGTPQSVRLSVDADELSPRPGSVRIFRVAQIATEIPSHFDVRFPVGNFPDPLMQIPDDGFVHPADGIHGVLLALRVGDDCLVGKRTVRVTASVGDESLAFELHCWVLPVRIPETPTLETALGCWPPKPTLLEDVGFGGTARDFQFVAAEEFRYVRFTPREGDMQWRHTGSALRGQLARWMHPPFNTLPIPRHVFENPERLRETWSLLDDLGIAHRAFVYLIDEPIRAFWPQMKERAAALRKVAPDLAIMATVYDSDPSPLFGVIDIWCRAVRKEPWMQARRAAGDRFWGVNISPMELESSLLELRKAFWRMAEHEFSGFLYWNVVGGYGGDNPWTDPFCAGINGNAHLLYATARGPTPSLRWLTMGQGCDDYDLLTLVRHAAASGAEAEGLRAKAFLEQLPGRLDTCGTWTDFETLRRDLMLVLQTGEK